MVCGVSFYLRLQPLATVMTRTEAAPARRSTREHSSTVEPVVKTSSTRTRCRSFTRAVCRTLKRTRYTSTQTKLDRAERMENLRGAFRVRHTARVKERHLVLVDDVFTTGSTVEECSRVLLRAGAASVRVITVARG